MNIKLVAIDLDGTLLGDDLKISPRAKEAIKRSMDEGVQVTLATGRMYRSALPYAKELGVQVPLITYQGGLVKMSSSGQVLYHKELSLNYAQEVIEMARKFGFHINAYLDDNLFVEEDTHLSRDYGRKTGVKIHLVDDLLEFLPDNPVKILLIGAEEQLDIMQEQCRNHFNNRVYITKSKHHFLEFTHPEATKGHGLRAVAQWMNVSTDEIMGIGDSYNDLEMFRSVGLSIVMGNARDEVKAAADYITGSCNDDGVAEALERFVLADKAVPSG